MQIAGCVLLLLAAVVMARQSKRMKKTTVSEKYADELLASANTAFEKVHAMSRQPTRWKRVRKGRDMKARQKQSTKDHIAKRKTELNKAWASAIDICKGMSTQARKHRHLSVGRKMWDSKIMKVRTLYIYIYKHFT